MSLERAKFDNEIRNWTSSHDWVKDDRGWILRGPQDNRGGNACYRFYLQQCKYRDPRRNWTSKYGDVKVVAGCRFFSIDKAWKHWGKKAKGPGWSHGRNEGRQALAIITLLLLQAERLGLLQRYGRRPKHKIAIPKEPQRKKLR